MTSLIQYFVLPQLFFCSIMCSLWFVFGWFIYESKLFTALVLAYFYLHHYSLLCNYFFPLYPSISFFDSVVAATLISFPFNILFSSSSSWAIPLTFQVAHLIWLCFFHFHHHHYSQHSTLYIPRYFSIVQWNTKAHTDANSKIIRDTFEASICSWP